MRSSYRQFIEEHEFIEQSAANLLGHLKDRDLPSSIISRELSDLAEIVEKHIVAESLVVAELDGRVMHGPWVEVWIEGKAGFEDLKRDWIQFLAKWNGQSIESARTLFTLEARKIFSRIDDRLQLETRSFYATALQNGAIELR